MIVEGDPVAPPSCLLKYEHANLICRASSKFDSKYTYL
jgi:hypothetical protein